MTIPPDTNPQTNQVKSPLATDSGRWADSRHCTIACLTIFCVVLRLLVSVSLFVCLSQPIAGYVTMIYHHGYYSLVHRLQYHTWVRTIKKDSQWHTREAVATASIALPMYPKLVITTVVWEYTINGNGTVGSTQLPLWVWIMFFCQPCW